MEPASIARKYAKKNGSHLPRFLDTFSLVEEDRVSRLVVCTYGGLLTLFEMRPPTQSLLTLRAEVVCATSGPSPEVFPTAGDRPPVAAHFSTAAL